MVLLHAGAGSKVSKFSGGAGVQKEVTRGKWRKLDFVTSATISLRNLRATGIRERRFLVALFLVWLGLLVQPCAVAASAAALSPGVSMEHCGHGAPMDPSPHCPAMQAGHCDMSVDANIDSSRTGMEEPVPVLSAVLATLAIADLPVDAACALLPDPGIRAGPSLHIRFCNLRN